MASSSGKGGTGYCCSSVRRSGSRLVATSLRLLAGGDQLGKARPAVEHLLQVVQQEERSAVPEVAVQIVSGADRLGDRRLDEQRIADLIERDPPDVLELVRDLGRELEGEARLPGARRPDERQQALLPEQADGVG